MQNNKTFDLLLEIVNKQYKDPMKPGILVSKIKKNKYYASILRFPKNKKTVVVSATGNSKEKAIDTLAKIWLDKQNSEKPKKR